MEVIQLAGYTEEEKLEIAKRYLVPRQIERNGLKKSWIAFGDRALRAIIADYTREAGVRSLEREIGTVCRKVARESPRATGNGAGAALDLRGRVRELLGSRASSPSQAPHAAPGRRHRPGLDAGRRRRAVHRGDGDARQGQLTITGQLGDVMRESAQAALSYVRAHEPRSRPAWRRLVRRARHPHPRARRGDPEGRAERGHHDDDGARVAAHGRCVRDDVAMTGEVTLTGQVLPIGGLKEKALAAQRSGIRTVVAPGAQRAGRGRDPRAPAPRT
jgi:ATP-dependent Lon protease